MGLPLNLPARKSTVLSLTTISALPLPSIDISSGLEYTPLLDDSNSIPVLGLRNCFCCLFLLPKLLLLTAESYGSC